MRYDPGRDLGWLLLRPWVAIPRLVQVLWSLAGLVLVLLLRGGSNDPAVQQGLARRILNTLTGLGPCFIKLGQALSTRPDLVRRDWLEELTRLQDDLPAFPHATALACIREELGAPAEELFEEFPDTPIAAASLGQVYKARLQGQHWVAVKVQRPNLTFILRRDLVLIRALGVMTAPLLPLNLGFGLGGIIDEFGRSLFEEIDYGLEAANAERFSALFADNDAVYIPKVERMLSSTRVLTTTWIDGAKMRDSEELRSQRLDPTALIRTGVICGLQQLLEFGYFHADPHPGNLLALEDGRLCYLDFGMMSEVSRESRTGLIQAVVHLVNRNFGKLSKDFVTLGFLAEDVNLEPIVPAFEKVFSQALEAGVNRMDFKAVTDDMSGVMYKFPFRVPPYYALIIRSLVTLEGIALSVDPNFKILGAAYPYFARRLMEDPDPQLRQSLKEMLFDGDAFRWTRLENLVSSAASQAQLDLEALLDQLLDFLFSPKAGLLRDQLVTATVDRLDALGWSTMQRLGRRLPKRLQPSALAQTPPGLSDPLMQLEPVRELILVLQSLPGFTLSLIHI
jgi:predicted unusual protein kinase regulating ubiquinone biosynthesis (AarF/ABC1/UbiB family)